MSHPNDSEQRGERVLAQLRGIAQEAADNVRRRLAADLAQFPIDEQAFSLAIDAYDEALPDDALRGDDQIEALRALVCAYIHWVGI